VHLFSVSVERHQLTEKGIHGFGDFVCVRTFTRRAA
jgi:hypothetical protein